MSSDLRPGRIVIDRLDLNLHGIDPATAEAALPLIGAAMQGRIVASASPAAALAQRIAASLTPHLSAQAVRQKNKE